MFFKCRVGADDAPQNRLPNNTAVLSRDYRVADALTSGNTNSGNKDNVTLRAILVLEPAFTGAAPGGGWEANAPKPLAPKTFTLVGWKTDGTALPPSEPRPRRIELVGDSISAGYGARGNAALHNKSLASNLDRALCPVNDQTSGITGTGTSNFIWRIAEHFNADLALLAWSGKGMFRNCCDPGEKMPAYWRQTLGGGNHTADWDHSRFVPDVMVIIRHHGMMALIASDCVWLITIGRLCVGDQPRHERRPERSSGDLSEQKLHGCNHCLRAQRGEGLPQPDAAGLRGARSDELRGGGKHEHIITVLSHC